MLVNCRLCGKEVAMDARRCAACGTRDFMPASPAASRAGAIAAALIVAGILLAGWSLFRTDDSNPYSLDPGQQAAFAVCEAAFLSIDSDAIVPPRPMVGGFFSWPSGHEVTVNGYRQSASCGFDDAGALGWLTLNSREVDISTLSGQM